MAMRRSYHVRSEPVRRLSDGGQRTGHDHCDRSDARLRLTRLGRPTRSGTHAMYGSGQSGAVLRHRLFAVPHDNRSMAMAHTAIEGDLRSLERLIARVALGEPVPWALWRIRLESILEDGCPTPSERTHFVSIIALLLMLERRAGKPAAH